MSSVVDAAGVRKQYPDDKDRQPFPEVPEAILLFDRDFCAVRVNQEFVRMFGYQQEEIVGKSDIIVHCPEKNSKYRPSTRQNQ